MILDQKRHAADVIFPWVISSEQPLIWTGTNLHYVDFPVKMLCSRYEVVLFRLYVKRGYDFREHLSQRKREILKAV